METTIDISMFNTDNLKLTLFYGLINQSLGGTRFATYDATLPQHSEILESIKRGYIDRYNGRVFKSDISEDVFYPRLYNRDNGQGKAESIVKNIRSQLGI
jgi:hypothetical protein